MHRKKRIATLRLLWEITRGANPKDALTAAGTAFALEGKLGLAVKCADSRPETLDRLNGEEPTRRDYLVARIEEYLAKKAR